MTQAHDERVKQPGAVVHGFAALGTDNLHAPRDPEAPDAPVAGEGRSPDPATAQASAPNVGDALMALVAELQADAQNVEPYQRIIGDELQALRHRRGWTRKDLQQQLPGDVSVQTLASYELGNRQCSAVPSDRAVPRHERTPQKLIARVHERIVSDGLGHITVNLRAFADARDPHLEPLRRWAEDRLRQPDAGMEIQLGFAALGHG